MAPAKTSAPTPPKPVPAPKRDRSTPSVPKERMPTQTKAPKADPAPQSGEDHKDIPSPDQAAAHPTVRAVLDVFDAQVSRVYPRPIAPPKTDASSSDEH